MSLDGKIQFMSDKLLKMYGYPVEQKDEVIGKSVLEFIDPSYFDMGIESINKLITGETPNNLRQYTAIKKDNGRFQVEVNSVVLLDSSGNQNSILVVQRDITERVKAENLLHQIRQNFESFFNTIDEFLFVLDEQGNIIHFNSTVIDRLGYTRAELIGSSVLMVHPPERRDEAGRIVGEMLSGTTEFCPVPIITKAGVCIPVETRVTTGLWDGKPAIFGVTKDISKIALSEEKFSKVFYLNPSACGLSDVVTGKYVEVNEAFCSLLGYKKDEVIGKTAEELGILTLEAKQAIFKNADKHGKITNIETDLIAKDGKIKNVLISAEYLNIQDKTLRYTVVNDITERKRMEDEIIRTNLELQKANSEKDKFFSIIAHDLRSPFQGLLGLSEIMASDDQKWTLDEFSQFSKALHVSIVNLYKLLENLLEWAMFQKGAMDFIPVEFGLSEMFIASIDSINEKARQKRITICREINDIDKIFADEKMISTVIRNLLTNAVKFTEKGGKVTVRANETRDGMIEISVTDTGVGIPDDVIDKLFIVGEKVGTTGTDDEPSTGLGLILCKEFVEKHNGKIWVESKEGVGSTFFFTIPKVL